MKAFVYQATLEDRRIRFIAAGTLAAGVNWAARFPLNTLMPFFAAVLCAAAIGMVVGFLLYRSFVFTGSQRAWHLQVRDFVIVNSLGAGITALVAVMLNDLLFVTSMLDLSAVAHAFGIGAGATANYLGHKAITFRLS